MRLDAAAGFFVSLGFSAAGLAGSAPSGFAFATVGEVGFFVLGAAEPFFVVFGLEIVALLAVEAFVASRADRRVGAVAAFFAGIVYG